MFDNSGKRLQSLAKGIFFLLCSVPVFLGVLMIIAGIFTSADSRIILVGILIIAFSVLIAWLSSIVLYAFGELVENTRLILMMQEKIYNRMVIDNNADADGE